MKNKASRYGLSSALFFTVALSILALPGAAWSSLRDEMRQFHDFLQDHPRVSADLRSNPNLVNNKKYLDKHDELDRFLRRHPSVKREVIERPHRVFGNYYRDVPSGWARR
jgi:hypothetical protein